ncbi:MAG: nucleotidyltransferase family protein [Selenomonas sp.]|nr:nucleotidyltransferase family protein [Selenomonas sp.]
MQANNQEAFFALVRAGLFPVHGEGGMVLERAKRPIRAHDFSNVDWGEVYRLAEEQSVVGLVAAGIDAVQGEWFKVNGSPLVPQEWALQFIGATLQIEQRNKAMNEIVAKLISLLRKNDIYAILVKGQGIAQCYEKPLWRASGDVDLLLSDTNYEKAKKLLTPLATEVETEFTHFKHLGMTIDGWEVELHGTLHSRLSRRVDNMIDSVQGNVFYGGEVRSWQNGKTQVFLPSPDNDVIFVFTHILHHFFFEGIGLRQICDWCRLLFCYYEKLDIRLLETRIRKAGLMTEWKVFASFAMAYLGMPVEAMPLYDADERWKRKADGICKFVMEVGNFGHNKQVLGRAKRQSRANGEGVKVHGYFWRKFNSFWGRLSDMLRHFKLFPKDSIVFFGGVLRSGLHAAVRGE